MNLEAFWCMLSKSFNQIVESVSLLAVDRVGFSRFLLVGVGLFYFLSFFFC